MPDHRIQRKRGGRAPLMRTLGARMRIMRITSGYCLSVAMALGLLCPPALVGEEPKLDLVGDFDRSVGEFRAETSVKREIPDCVGPERRANDW